MNRLTKILPALLLLSCALLFAPAAAHADPIEITSGVWVASNPSPNAWRWRSYAYDLNGNGLRMLGGDGDGLNQPVRVVGCHPCNAGDAFYLSHPGSLFAFTPTQTLYLDGERHVGWNQSVLNFNTDPFVLPASGGDLITLTGHFTMTGSIAFDPYIVVNPVDMPPFVVGDMYGSGIVTMQFTRIFGAYYMSNVRYDFQQTPEPMTLVLLGSGLAGLAAHRRRRRRTGSPQ